MDVLKKILQFLFIIAVLPFVFAAVYHLPSHMVAYPTDMLKLFITGGAVFVAVYLFIYQCREIYVAGQGVIQKIFSFSPAIQPAMSGIFSFYLFLAVIVFFIVSRGFGLSEYNPPLMFMMGFFFAMHNVLTAVEMQEQDKSRIFKVGYLSSFILILLANIIILILLFDAVKWRFTFLEYAGKVVDSGCNYIIQAIDRMPFFK